MAVYLVAYELKQSRQYYRDLFSAIGAYDASPLLDGAHLIDAPTDADTLREHLAALAGPNDRIWVSRVTEDHSGYVMAGAGEWLEERKPL
jgi:hypothetical protein